jgi:uncharacterized protein YuzE
METLLLSFGCNIASSVVYDLVKKLTISGITADKIVNELATKLECRNSTELSAKIIELLNKEGAIEMNEITGDIFLCVDKADRVVGVEITKPTHIKPGTKIITDVGEANSVIGLRIG